MEEHHRDRNARPSAVVLVPKLELAGGRPAALLFLAFAFLGVSLIGTKTETSPSIWRRRHADHGRHHNDHCEQQRNDAQIENSSTEPSFPQQQHQPKRRRRPAHEKEKPGRIPAQRDDPVGQVEGPVDRAVAMRNEELREGDGDEKKLEDGDDRPPRGPGSHCRTADRGHQQRRQRTCKPERAYRAQRGRQHGTMGQ